MFSYFFTAVKVVLTAFTKIFSTLTYRCHNCGLNFNEMILNETGGTMTSSKRIIIATFVGLICGLICMGMAASDPTQPVSLGIKLSILTGRTLMGFTIGISALKMKWVLHGILIGFLTSIPMAMPLLEQPTLLMATVLMGIIYGFIIELVTSVFFKAKRPGKEFA